MPTAKPSAILLAFFYGCASVVLLFNIFFLLRGVFIANFVPILPIFVSTLCTSGLLLLLYAEYQARQRDRREHHRIGGVAHQLEMPLSTLQTDFKILLDQAEKLPPEARLKLKHMATRTEVILENIRDIFLLLQAQAGPLTQEPRLYDVCAVVTDAVAKQRPLAQARNTRIMHHFHCQHATVRVDKGLLLVVLNHLIENAITYTLTPGLVNVTIVRTRTHAKVLVQDRGVGIKPSTRRHLWQPFARGRSAQQFDPNGIGVGLCLSRLIMSAMGGSIAYHPRTDSTGSQFEIKLPLAKTK